MVFLSKTHNPSLIREKQYRNSNRGTSLQNTTPNNSQGHKKQRNSKNCHSKGNSRDMTLNRMFYPECDPVRGKRLVINKNNWNKLWTLYNNIGSLFVSNVPF